MVIHPLVMTNIAMENGPFLEDSLYDLPIKNAPIHGISRSINSHVRILNWRYLPHIRPMQGLCKGISPQNMALYGTNVPPF